MRVVDRIVMESMVQVKHLIEVDEWMHPMHVVHLLMYEDDYDRNRVHQVMVDNYEIVVYLVWLEA